MRFVFTLFPQIRQATCSPRLPRLRVANWLLPLAWVLATGPLARAQTPTGGAIPSLPYWEWQNPLPTGYDLAAAHVFNDSTAIVVGGHGTALKTRDRGRTWQALHVGTTDRLTHVSFANALVGWVAVLTPPTDQYPITRPYAGIGEVRRTTDGGLTWTRQQLENSGTQIRTLRAISPTEAYVGYEERICTDPNSPCGGYPTPRLRRTTDGGQSWLLVNTTYPLLQFVTPGMAVIAREEQGHGSLLRTRDGGQTFRDITPAVQQDRYFGQAVFVDSLRGWVTSNTLYFTYPPNLYRTQDGGRTWTEQHARADFLNPEQALVGLAFADSLHGVATLSGGGVLATADGGRTWAQGFDAVTYQSANVAGPVWATAGGHGYWSVGKAGRVTVSVTDGRTWTNPTRNLSEGVDNYNGNQLKQVQILDATHGWVWGPRQLLRTASRGAQWDSFRPDSISGMPLTYTYVRAAGFTDRDTGCVVVQASTFNGIRSGLRASVVRTTDGGQHWTTRLDLLSVPLQPYGLYGDQRGGVQALRFGTARRAVLVGDSGTIFATQDGGRSWSRRVSPTRHRLTDVAWAGPAGRTVYASGDSATLCRSDDGGQTWRLVRVDSASYMANAGQFWPAAFPPDQAVRGIVFTSPEVGYLPYYNGVAKTTNGGRTWASTTHLDSRSSMRSNGARNPYPLNLYFRSPREGWYFGDDSFRTTDAGLTWTKLPELGDVLGGPMTGGGGTLADSYNAWIVGSGGRILHYSEKFIQAAPLAQTTYAPGQTLALAFTATNVTSTDFRVQLSNRAGRFRAGEVREVGRGTASPLSVTLPANLSTGTAYRLRVVLGDSSVLGADNGQDLAIVAAAAVTWTGAVNTRWELAGNWNPTQVPGATTDVTIPAVPNQPLVSTAGATCAALTTQANTTLTIAAPGYLTATGTLVFGGQLAMSSGTLEAQADIRFTQSFVATGGLVLLSGTAAQEVGCNGCPTTFWNLTVGPKASNSGVRQFNAFRIRRVLRLEGDLSPNTGGLTLLSDASGTAMVVNAGGRVQGFAQMERYLAGPNTGLGYRHLSAPSPFGSVGSFYGQGFAPVVNAAYNTVGNTARPFPTFFGFDESRLGTAGVPGPVGFDQGWVSPATTSDALAAGRGYTVNVAGTVTPTFGGFFATGPVAVGALSRSGSGLFAGYHLLGNPYPSPLAWDQVTKPTGLDDAVYVFRSTRQYAGFYDFYVNGMGTLAGGEIAAMQGFFVRVSQPVPAFGFTDAARLTTYANPTYQRGLADTRPTLALALRPATGPAPVEADKAFVYFEVGATAAYDAHYDAAKLPNPGGLSLTSLLGGQGYAVNGLPLLGTAPLVLPLAMDVPAAGPYELAIDQLANFAPGTTLYLRDALLSTLTLLTASTRYAFTLAGPSAPGRFSIEFRPAGALATAAQLLDAQVQVFPNPVAGGASVTVAAPAQARVSVLNALGQLVLPAITVAPTAALALPTAGLPAGLYLVQVTTSAATVVKRLLVE